MKEKTKQIVIESYSGMNGIDVLKRTQDLKNLEILLLTTSGRLTKIKCEAFSTTSISRFDIDDLATVIAFEILKANSFPPIKS